MSAQFTKNVFYNNEWAGCDLHINNNESQLPIREVEFQVCQRLFLGTPGGWGRTHTENFDVLENQDHAVIAAHHPDPVVKQMGLNLANIVYHASPTQKRKVKGEGFFGSTHKVDVPRSKEEMFQLTNLPPATHSDMITNTYTLNANVKFEGGCCVEGNSISVPLTIIPVVYESWGFTEPPEYNPYMLGEAQINLNTHLYI